MHWGTHRYFVAEGLQVRYLMIKWHFKSICDRCLSMSTLASTWERILWYKATGNCWQYFILAVYVLVKIQLCTYNCGREGETYIKRYIMKKWKKTDMGGGKAKFIANLTLICNLMKDMKRRALFKTPTEFFNHVNNSLFHWICQSKKW